LSLHHFRPLQKRIFPARRPCVTSFRSPSHGGAGGRDRPGAPWSSGGVAGLRRCGLCAPGVDPMAGVQRLGDPDGLTSGVAAHRSPTRRHRLFWRCGLYRPGRVGRYGPSASRGACRPDGQVRPSGHGTVPCPRPAMVDGVGPNRRLADSCPPRPSQRVSTRCSVGGLAAHRRESLSSATSSAGGTSGRRAAVPLRRMASRPTSDTSKPVSIDPPLDHYVNTGRHLGLAQPARVSPASTSLNLLSPSTNLLAGQDSINCEWASLLGVSHAASCGARMASATS
jgi:hypothetical protein